MRKKIFISFIMVLNSLFYCTATNNNTDFIRKTLFSNNWYFTRLNDSANHSKFGKKVQTGKDWKSQYFIETVNTKGDEDLPFKTLKGELNLLKQKKWEKVNLPHTAYTEPLVIKKPWQGIAYYRKSFFVLKKDKKFNLFLRFKGAMQLAHVWINGKFVKKHAGGYTPFEIKLNKFIKYGKINEILVRTDNRDNPLIPPGKPQDRLDFCYYSGLYRDIYLIKTGKIYIPNPVSADMPAAGGIFVRYPIANRKKAVISIKTTIKNDMNEMKKIKLSQIISDKNGNLIKMIENQFYIKAKEFKIINQKIVLKNHRLWSIENPYLYQLITEIRNDNILSDRIKTKIGIRRFSFTRDKGFLLNGKPIKLIGSNRHQEYPYIGNALSDNAQFRDMVKIKNGGFNIVRLGHYPQDSSVLDACDELGLLVIEPIPGWQFFNENSLFVSRTFKTIKDMIRRDRNHPSVILWETVLNESRLPMWWKKKAYEIAHKEYPGNQCYTAGDMYGTYVWDVLYNDWHEDFTRPNNSNKPGFIREYGDYEFGGDKSTTRQRRGAGEKKLLQSAWNFQWSFNRYNAYYPWTTGNAIWEMFDHNRGCCPTISASGASDIFRIPKFTWHFFRAQLNPKDKIAFGYMKPEVYIANYWTKANKPQKIIVYGNVNQVELQINGKTIGKRKPDNGKDSFYFKQGENPYSGGHPYEGGNCKNIHHPPWTFKNIKWEKGELKAIGYINNRKVAEYIVKTPEKPSKLEIAVDFSGRFPEIGKKDILFVYVKIKDKNNTLCISDNKTEINLAVKGAKILSPSKIKAEAGIATFLISTFDKSPVIIKAKNGLNLQSIFKLKLKK
jgi:beta-galactosidase